MSSSPRVTEAVVRRLIREEMGQPTGTRAVLPARPADDPSNAAGKLVLDALREGPREVYEMRAIAESKAIMWHRVEAARARLNVRTKKTADGEIWELAPGAPAEPKSWPRRSVSIPWERYAIEQVLAAWRDGRATTEASLEAIADVYRTIPASVLRAELLEAIFETGASMGTSNRLIETALGNFPGSKQVRLTDSEFRAVRLACAIVVDQPDTATESERVSLLSALLKMLPSDCYLEVNRSADGDEIKLRSDRDSATLVDAQRTRGA